jgi:hypothetical protein
MLPQKFKSAAGGIAISSDLSALPPLIVVSRTASDVRDEQAQTTVLSQFRGFKGQG